MAIIVSAVGTDGDGEGTEAVDDSVFCGQGGHVQGRVLEHDGIRDHDGLRCVLDYLVASVVVECWSNIETFMAAIIPRVTGRGFVVDE